MPNRNVKSKFRELDKEIASDSGSFDTQRITSETIEGLRNFRKKL